MPPYNLKKWEIIRVWFHDLKRPHDKFCICICPLRGWFLFINSERPFGRKAKEYAIDLQNYELRCLSHTSYIDTTTLEIIDDDRVNLAMEDEDRFHGLLTPSIKKRVIGAVIAHGALPDEQHTTLLDGEETQATPS